MALLDEARAVPNESDAAFIICQIGDCIPSSEKQLRTAVVDEAEQRIAVLNSLQDRFARFVDLADILVGRDSSGAKRVLQKAHKVFANHDSIKKSPHRLIDVAYRLDPDLASSMAAALDTEPARKGSGERLRQALKLKDLAKNIVNTSDGGGGPEQSSQAAWIALADLNSGRGAPLQAQRIWDCIQQGAALPLRVSYPLLALAFASAGRQFAGTDTSAELLRALFDGVIAATSVAAELTCRAAVRARSSDATTQSKAATLVVGVGSAKAALEWLGGWCRANVSNSLLICDPYFGLKDIVALKLITACAPEATVQILTSKHALRSVASPHDEAFRQFWREQIASCDLPLTEVLAAGIGPGGQSPIHDRWWLTPSAGIRMGTSFSGLGIRESEISTLSADEVTIIHNELRPYVQRRRIVSGGERIDYAMFSL